MIEVYRYVGPALLGQAQTEEEARKIVLQYAPNAIFGEWEQESAHMVLRIMNEEGQQLASLWKVA